MGKLFKKKVKPIPTTPPEEEESLEELEVEDDDDDDYEEEEVKKSPTVKQDKAKPVPEYREIPVCLSEAQIYNLIIENNMMLKQIVSEMNA